MSGSYEIRLWDNFGTRTILSFTQPFTLPPQSNLATEFGRLMAIDRNQRARTVTELRRLHEIAQNNP